jgi:hypothetical protein
MRFGDSRRGQLFCGEEFFQHRAPFDRSSMTRWRQRLGEEKVAALIQESLNVAPRTGAAKPTSCTPPGGLISREGREKGSSQ